MDEMEGMIRVSRVKKHYENGLVRALNGVSFEIGEGEIVSLMGPSGCGKSTLLRLVGTLDFPSEGTVHIAGRDIRDQKPLHRFRREYIGFVFQFHHLIPSLSLLENVEIPLLPTSVSRRVRRERAARLLEEMGLAERMTFFPNKISGGERQRAAIARAMVNDPRIILADEPTGNIDTLTGERILDFLLGTCREKRITMLMATHNHEVAARTDRGIGMRNGLLEI
jgi:putative ABC transport system ATP-binding protein